jgi:hypothetical protein
MLEPGSQIGRYEIQRRLGRGGMGSVYVAHDPVLGRMVAVKVFAGDLDIPDARERFSREARAAAALNHPNIVTIYDFGEYASQPFIVMEYVAGETLLAMIRRKAPVSTADKLRWMDELCGGVGYAHGMSVIHRDLKPANLMIDRSGRLKILDFGVARMMGTASNTVAMVGTPGYMSPEQIHGDAVDHRSDLFSIGVVLYELLSYREAFPGDTVPTIMHRVLSDSPISLAHLVPELGPDAVGIVDRLLEKKPADRFDDAESLRTALSRVRRKIAPDSHWDDGATRIVRRDTPPAFGGGGRGTGSARKGSERDGGVAALTPPPDPPRTDREAVARRSVEKLNAALVRARACFAAGELEKAREECEQALTFGEDNTDALVLEQQILAALEARYTVGRSTRGSAEVAPLEAAEAALVPAVPTVVASDAVVPGPVLVPGNAGGNPDSQKGDTVLAPVRRTPAPAQTSHLQHSRQATTFTATAIQLFKKVSGLVREAEVAVAAYPRRKKAVVFVAALLLTVTAVTAGMLLTRATVVPMGTLVIDATPWASIEAIESESGQRQPLPSIATTPLSLSLPEGNYWVALTGPPPNGQSQRVSVRVATGAAVVMPTVRFSDITVEQYFEQYLSFSATDDPPVAPINDGQSSPTAPLTSAPVGGASSSTPGVSQ